MSLAYKNNDSRVFSVTYTAFWGPLSLIALISILWISLFLSYSFVWLVCVLSLSSGFLYLLKYVTEGFSLQLNSEDQKGVLVRWHGFGRWKETTSDQFAINDIRDLVIETRLNTERLILVTSKNKLSFTKAFDNTGRYSTLAHDLLTWLRTKNFEVTTRSESVTYRIEDTP